MTTITRMLKLKTDPVEDLKQYTQRDDMIIPCLKANHQTYDRVVSSQVSAEISDNATNSEQESLKSQVIDFLDSVNVRSSRRDS